MNKIIIGGFFLLAGFSTACGASESGSDEGAPLPSSVPASVSQSVLDTEALERALTNQGRMEAAGFRLVGRAWSSPRSYAGYYEGAFGATVLRFTAPEDLGAPAEREPGEEESFEAYVARVGSRGRLDDLEQDVILFAPADHSDGVAQSRAALSDLEEVARILQQCTDDARNLCAKRFGFESYGNPLATVAVWDRVAQPSFTESARGTAYAVGACAHSTGGTVTFRFAKPDYSPAPANFTLDIGPLERFIKWFRMGWEETRSCGWTNIFGSCVGWDFAMNFNQVDMSLSFSGRNGGAFQHYCGAITRNDDFWRLEKPKNAWCEDREGCIVKVPY